jgi:hypothetical protein
VLFDLSSNKYDFATKKINEWNKDLEKLKYDINRMQLNEKNPYVAKYNQTPVTNDSLALRSIVQPAKLQPKEPEKKDLNDSKVVAELKDAPGDVETELKKDINKLIGHINKWEEYGNDVNIAMANLLEKYKYGSYYHLLIYNYVAIGGDNGHEVLDWIKRWLDAHDDLKYVIGIILLNSEGNEYMNKYGTRIDGTKTDIEYMDFAKKNTENGKNDDDLEIKNKLEFFIDELSKTMMPDVIDALDKLQKKYNYGLYYNYILHDSISLKTANSKDIIKLIESWENSVGTLNNAIDLALKKMKKGYRVEHQKLAENNSPLVQRPVLPAITPPAAPDSIKGGHAEVTPIGQAVYTLIYMFIIFAAACLLYICGNSPGKKYRMMAVAPQYTTFGEFAPNYRFR